MLALSRCCSMGARTELFASHKEHRNIQDYRMNRTPRTVGFLCGIEGVVCFTFSWRFDSRKATRKFRIVRRAGGRHCCLLGSGTVHPSASLFLI